MRGCPVVISGHKQQQRENSACTIIIHTDIAAVSFYLCYLNAVISTTKTSLKEWKFLLCRKKKTTIQKCYFGIKKVIYGEIFSKNDLTDCI